MQRIEMYEPSYDFKDEKSNQPHVKEYLDSFLPTVLTTIVLDYYTLERVEHFRFLAEELLEYAQSNGVPELVRSFLEKVLKNTLPSLKPEEIVRTTTVLGTDEEYSITRIQEFLDQELRVGPGRWEGPIKEFINEFHKIFYSRGQIEVWRKAIALYRAAISFSGTEYLLNPAERTVFLQTMNFTYALYHKYTSTKEPSFDPAYLRGYGIENTMHIFFQNHEDLYSVFLFPWNNTLKEAFISIGDKTQVWLKYRDQLATGPAISQARESKGLLDELQSKKGNLFEKDSQTLEVYQQLLQTIIEEKMNYALPLVYRAHINMIKAVASDFPFHK